MTPRWKQRVRDRLAENKRNDVFPRDQVELGEAIGVEKSSITKMLQASSSKLVPKVCAALLVPAPMQEREEHDDLDDLLKDAGPEKRLRIAQALRLLGF